MSTKFVEFKTSPSMPGPGAANHSNETQSYRAIIRGIIEDNSEESGGNGKCKDVRVYIADMEDAIHSGIEKATNGFANTIPEDIHFKVTMRML